MSLSSSHLLCTFLSIFFSLFITFLLFWHEQLVSWRAAQTALIFAFLGNAGEKGKTASLCLSFSFLFYIAYFFFFLLNLELSFWKQREKRLHFFLLPYDFSVILISVIFNKVLGCWQTANHFLWQLLGRITPISLCPYNERWNKRQLQYTFYFTEKSYT